jgi:ElaB/YqjD/DUF883 family membrane-anchored ribosome-binding protein
MVSIDLNKEHFNSKHIQEAGEELLDEGRKFVHDLQDQGRDKLNAVKKEATEYSDELLELVRNHPLQSMLIAGGIGFLLSRLLKK